MVFQLSQCRVWEQKRVCEFEFTKIVAVAATDQKTQRERDIGSQGRRDGVEGEREGDGGRS